MADIIVSSLVVAGILVLVAVMVGRSPRPDREASLRLADESDRLPTGSVDLRGSSSRDAVFELDAQIQREYTPGA